MKIWDNRHKDRGAIGITTQAYTTNDTAQFVSMGQFVQEAIVISQGDNGYLFGQGAYPLTLGITLGAQLPNGKQFRIRGPAAFQVASAGSQVMSIVQYLSSTGISEFEANIDTGNILLENGDNLVTELGEKLEIESA